LKLEDLGWDAFFADAFEPYAADNLIPARVSARHHGPCELLTERGRMGGLPAGKLSDAELPAVGDWVAARPVEGEKKAVIEAVLPRRTSFSRKEAFQRTVEQVVAANVDTVFVVTAFGFDLNPRRLERYLTAAWDSGSNPVIVVNKADTADDPLSELAVVESVTIGVPVHAVSAVTGEGLDELDA
jgi:ribosome biogenesis GTPase